MQEIKKEKNEALSDEQLENVSGGTDLSQVHGSDGSVTQANIHLTNPDPNAGLADCSPYELGLIKEIKANPNDQDAIDALNAYESAKTANGGHMPY